MKFSKLAEYFEKLEKTSKRLELVDILSKLFREAKSGEIGEICYLIQGRVAPFYEPVEIGMAEKMVAEAIGKAAGKSKEEVLKLYRSKGNMGLAAQELASKQEGKSLTVSEVFSKLLEISSFSGEGTVEKKVGTLASILSQLDPVSCKHVVNIPLGTLRLGIGGPTVLDALSLAKKGDKSLRPVLEAAYNRTSDLGYVAKIYWLKGEKGVGNLKLIVGKPIRSALAERMPNAKEVVKRMGDEFAAEPKFDGFRVQVHLDRSDKPFDAALATVGPAGLHPTPILRQVQDKLDKVYLEQSREAAATQESSRPSPVKLFSRNLENTTAAFPDIVEGVLKEVNAKSAILDGEAIAYNPQTEEFLPFQETTKRRRKYKVEEMAQKLPLVLFTFDLLYLNGEDITSLPYWQRRKRLSGIVKEEGSSIRLAEKRILHKEEDILKFFNEAISEGLEGIMIKKLDSPYVAGGRGFHWIKFKRASSGELTDTVDCVLLGIYAGRGKRTEFGVGGLLVGIYDQKKDEFVTISRVGTGLTDEEFRRIKTISDKLKVTKKPPRVNSKIEPSLWVEPKVVLEIFADEITKSPIHTAGEEDGIGYALRFPRLVKFREEDKRPEDATTVDEIKEMYQYQYKHKKS